jgi:hypothetical protein
MHDQPTRSKEKSAVKTPAQIRLFQQAGWLNDTLAAFLSRFLPETNDPSDQLKIQEPTVVYAENHFPQL